MSNIMQTSGINTRSILRKGIYFLLLMLILSSISSLAEQSEKQSAFLGITEILDAWEAGYGSIHSMKVQYTEDISLLNPSGQETTLHSTLERIDDGKKFYMKYLTSNPDFPASETDIEAAFDGGISTFCDQRINVGKVEDGIATKGYENLNSLAEYMWLSRYYINSDYPDGQTYFAFWIRAYILQGNTNNKYSVRVLPELETVMGELCHVVELVSTIGTRKQQKFWLAHNKGMCPMKYERSMNQEVVNKVEVMDIAKVMTDIGEVWYPKEVKKVAVDTRVNIGRVQISQFQVQEFEPYLANIAPDTFKVNFPDGTYIIDNVLGIEYVKGDIKNALNELNNERFQSTQIQSLESDSTRSTLNNTSKSIAIDEPQGASNVDGNQEGRGVLGDIQDPLYKHKYAYILFACLVLIISTGITVYFCYRTIKRR